VEESSGNGDLVGREAQEVGGLGARHLPLHGFWEAWMLLPQNIEHLASKIRRSFLQLERVCADGDGLTVVAVDSANKVRRCSDPHRPAAGHPPCVNAKVKTGTAWWRRWRSRPPLDGGEAAATLRQEATTAPQQQGKAAGEESGEGGDSAVGGTT
jgi:hypothetical protein